MVPANYIAQEELRPAPLCVRVYDKNGKAYSKLMTLEVRVMPPIGMTYDNKQIDDTFVMTRLVPRRSRDGKLVFTNLGRGMDATNDWIDYMNTKGDGWTGDHTLVPTVVGPGIIQKY